MKQESKKTLRNYGICLGVEAVIAFLVIWSKGFLVHSPAVNLQILADAFFVAGILMSLFAGLLYVSSEGALIGISFVLRNVALAFVPMGRARHEKYADYRARKLGQIKKSGDHSILVTGLSVLFVGIVLTVIWYAVFYNA